MDASTHTSLHSLSIGGATYDLFLTFEKGVELGHDAITFPVGGKTPIRSVTELCGGGAANTSVGFSRLGCAASFCGVLGSDQWGEVMLQTLKKERVDTSSATIVEGETSSFSVIVTAGNDRSILAAPGVSEHLHDVTFDQEAVSHADIVYLNHLSESSCVIENDMVRMLSSSAGHLTWNPGGCQIEAGMHAPDKIALLRHTNLLLLNKEEASLFTDTKTIEEAMTKLIEAGVEHVCITDGKHGVFAASKSERWHCPIIKTTVVDTTGAGDAFGTGATWALKKGLGLQKALVAGTLNAVSVVSAIGAQTGLLTEKEMIEKLPQHPLAISSFSS